MSACKGGHLEVVNYLVAEGVDVNAMNKVSSHDDILVEASSNT
jgi:ankyrin repeat protein